MRIQIVNKLSTLFNLSEHLNPLIGLGSVSVTASIANFLAIFMIVVYSPLEVYAAYTIGQAILALSSAWSDGGLANTMQVMAAQQGDQRGAFELYKKAGMKFSWRIVPFAYLTILALVYVLLQFSNVLVKVDFYVLAGFGVIGILNARASFCSALIYAVGQFKSYSISRSAAAPARPLLIGTAVLACETLRLDVLMTVEMLASLFGWGIANYYLKVGTKRLAPSPCIEHQKDIDSKVKRFLKPSLFAVSFGSLAHNLNIIGSSLFAINISIAAFGVFQRINQIFATFSGTLIPYGSRRLRLISESADRRQKEIFSVYGIMLTYGGYSFLCILLYQIAGRYFEHYSLNYPVEFFIFLVVNGLGYLTVTLNSILLARGGAHHLIPGTLMQLISIAVLISLVHPNSLIQIVSIHGASLLPTLSYYGFLFAHRDR